MPVPLHRHECLYYWCYLKYIMPLGRLLIVAGIVLVVVGLLAAHTPLRLGRLPGDIYIHGKNFTFYFPLTTCILLSALVSLVVWLLRK